MFGRVRCILYMGVVTGLIGLAPAQCQQPAGSKVVSPHSQKLGSRAPCSSPYPKYIRPSARQRRVRWAPRVVPRPEDLVRGAVPFVESEEHRLG